MDRLFHTDGVVFFDLVKTSPMAPPYLESIHPVLMGHGVIVSMLISGTVFITVSLLSLPSEEKMLAPFFTGDVGSEYQNAGAAGDITGDTVQQN